MFNSALSAHGMGVPFCCGVVGVLAQLLLSVQFRGVQCAAEAAKFACEPTAEPMHETQNLQMRIRFYTTSIGLHATIGLGKNVYAAVHKNAAQRATDNYKWLPLLPAGEREHPHPRESHQLTRSSTKTQATSTHGSGLLKR